MVLFYDSILSPAKKLINKPNLKKKPPKNQNQTTTITKKTQPLNVSNLLVLFLLLSLKKVLIENILKKFCYLHTITILWILYVAQDSFSSFKAA